MEEIMKGFERITFDPNIMGGQACIRGMRVPVSLVVNLVANGMKTEDILNEYPDLEPEDLALTGCARNDIYYEDRKERFGCCGPAFWQNNNLQNNNLRNYN